MNIVAFSAGVPPFEKARSILQPIIEKSEVAETKDLLDLCRIVQEEVVALRKYLQRYFRRMGSGWVRKDSHRMWPIGVDLDGSILIGWCMAHMIIVSPA